MENIYVQMKISKILKASEYAAVGDKLTNDTHVFEVLNENIAVKHSEPLYESSMSITKKIENAVIALPEDTVDIESLTNTVTKFLKDQQIKGEHGFSVGNYFASDYASSGSKWNEKSLCVSLWGDVSDRAGTIAVAVECMRVHNLPRILIVADNCIMEITRDSSEIKPLPQQRIKKLGD